MNMHRICCQCDWSSCNVHVVVASLTSFTCRDPPTPCIHAMDGEGGGQPSREVPSVALDRLFLELHDQLPKDAREKFAQLADEVKRLAESSTAEAPVTPPYSADQAVARREEEIATANAEQSSGELQAQGRACYLFALSEFEGRYSIELLGRALSEPHLVSCMAGAGVGMYVCICMYLCNRQIFAVCPLQFCTVRKWLSLASRSPENVSLRSVSSEHYIERNESSSTPLSIVIDIRFEIGKTSDYCSCPVYSLQCKTSQ